MIHYTLTEYKQRKNINEKLRKLQDGEINHFRLDNKCIEIGSVEEEL